MTENFNGFETMMSAHRSILNCFQLHLKAPDEAEKQIHEVTAGLAVAKEIFDVPRSQFTSIYAEQVAPNKYLNVHSIQLLSKYNTMHRRLLNSKNIWS